MFSDVWITTAGTVDDGVARRIGDAVRRCKVVNRSTPTIIGFAKLSDSENDKKIRDSSTADEQVFICSLSSID